MLTSPQDFPRVALASKKQIEPLRTNLAAVEQLEQMITEHVAGPGDPDEPKPGKIPGNAAAGTEHSSPKGSPPCD
jgi:hypothetical protein